MDHRIRRAGRASSRSQRPAVSGVAGGDLGGRAVSGQPGGQSGGPGRGRAAAGDQHQSGGPGRGQVPGYQPPQGTRPAGDQYPAVRTPRQLDQVTRMALADQVARTGGGDPCPGQPGNQQPILPHRELRFPQCCTGRDQLTGPGQLVDVGQDHSAGVFRRCCPNQARHRRRGHLYRRPGPGVNRPAGHHHQPRPGRGRVGEPLLDQAQHPPGQLPRGPRHIIRRLRQAARHDHVGNRPASRHQGSEILMASGPGYLQSRVFAHQRRLRRGTSLAPRRRDPVHPEQRVASQRLARPGRLAGSGRSTSDSTEATSAPAPSASRTETPPSAAGAIRTRAVVAPEACTAKPDHANGSVSPSSGSSPSVIACRAASRSAGWIVNPAAEVPAAARPPRRSPARAARPPAAPGTSGP